MTYLSLLALCFIFTISSVLAEEFPRVKTENGELKGVYLQSRDGKQYSAFLGIRYAEPPQRYKLAKPPKPWSGIREAVEFGDICAQNNPNPLINVPLLGSEDCLFLNVYSPQLDGNLPVMVWIHGGGFFAGSSDLYREKYFMDEPVVLVTLNYRLGALGFLNTDDGEVEANLGLKDQLLALQFVQKNIKEFGGDPSKVTIFGESAGGALVHHHVLSPLSKGLFSKAIVQSGTALAWGVMKQPRLQAFKLGKLLRCFSDKSEETSEVLLDCLKNETAENIIKQNIKIFEWYIDPIAAFAPSIEKPGKSEQIFLAEAPINILKSGNFNKVPIIFVVCEEEGLILNALPVVRNEMLTKDINDDYLLVLPITLFYKFEGYYPYEQNWLSNQIKNFYFGPNKIDMSTLKNLTAMYSDRGWNYPTEKSAALHSMHSKTYSGIFTFKGNWTAASIFGITVNLGVTHGDEVQYLFNGGFNYPNLDPKFPEGEMSKALVKLWTTFASTEDALKLEGVAWDPLDPSKVKQQGISHLTLNLAPKVLQNPYKERMEFWDNILDGARPGDLPKLITL